MQAEHGIAACSTSALLPLRLHTTTLPRGLGLDQLGAVLLANELEWSGLVPAPEQGLLGEFFVVRKPGPGESLDGDDFPQDAAAHEPTGLRAHGPRGKTRR